MPIMEMTIIDYQEWKTKNCNCKCVNWWIFSQNSQFDYGEFKICHGYYAWTGNSNDVSVQENKGIIG